MDLIKIENLEIYAAHGVFSEETRNGQSFFVDAVLHSDLRPAGQTDDLHLSTHYGEVCHFMNHYFKEHTFQLIEAATEHLAKEILLQFPRVEAIELELKKPSAPIGLPFSNVSVSITRGWKQVYLGIGSNMGDSESFVEKAMMSIKENPEIKDVVCSKIIRTAPYGGVEQDDFLNGAIGLKTLLTPYELLDFVHKIEQDAGRERKVHWGPRTLDLDILFYQDFISDDPALTVPHPDMKNRQFVLEPLNEICPYYINPIVGKSVRQMWEELQ